MKEIFDPIRKKWVAATPEEIVRQAWLEKMVCQLQFPQELLAVEKELRSFSLHPQAPDRRLDILCFMKSKDHLKPLLLVECKCGLITRQAIDQAASYNDYVQAPYIAVVNSAEVVFRCLDREMTHMPLFSELIVGL